MNLNVENWAEFEIGELFVTVTGYYNNKPETSPSGIPFLGGSDSNNGRTSFVSYDAVYSTNKVGKQDSSIEGKIFDGNCITVTTDGSVCYAYYQPEQFTGSHSFIALYPKSFVLNESIALFICTVINKERYRFSYGRKIHSEAKMQKMRIKLPADKDRNPDFKFMEDYVASINHKPITTKITPNKTKTLETENWKEFRIGDLLAKKPYKAKAYNDSDLEKTLPNDENSMPYITRTETNNGCKHFVKRDDSLKFEKGNAIVVGDTTSTISYQENDFICGDHIVVLRFPKLNKYLGLFLVNVLKQERFRYSYGRAFTMDLIEDTLVKLPNNNGSPDWVFMENYIKSLPYGDRI